MRPQARVSLKIRQFPAPYSAARVIIGGDEQMLNEQAYEKWLWIELIGFDNELPDFGVAAYLDKIGFTPAGVSLLFFTPDFVHVYGSLDEERTLPPEICSYAARPTGKEHDRQVWTNVQLKQLVAELQKHGVGVYCSFFNLFQYELDGEIYNGEWCGSHPELYEMGGNGKPFQMLNPLRRYKDGAFYEDDFVLRLAEAMSAYGFDGYHGADGYTSPRMCLAYADYSDDMVEQFVMSGGTDPGDERLAACDGDAERMKRRSEWIWESKRLEWIRFYAERWETFWRKVVSAVHKDGKKVVFNTAWTRDPFEALYRYGVDYRRIADAGVDAFIVEAGAAALSAGGVDIEMEPLNEFKATLMAIKAYVPEMKLIYLNTIHDTMEQWDAIQHAPTLLERDIYALSNVFLHDGEGKAIRCASGLMACLADGMSREEWKWVRSRWDFGFAHQPAGTVGVSLVWSDKVLYDELGEYSESREFSSHKFAHELIGKGAPLHSIVRSGDLGRKHGAILAANVHLLPDEELRRVLDYRNGPVVVLGRLSGRLSEAGIRLAGEDGLQPDDLFCAVRELPDHESFRLIAVERAESRERTEIKAADDAISWIYSLRFQPVSDSFLSECAAGMTECAGSPRIMTENEFVTLASTETPEGTWFLVIGNSSLIYRSPTIDVGRPIASVSARGGYPYLPVPHKGSSLRVKVPGRGMVMLEVRFA
ncbi:hypothetical protein DQG23_17265 [Paenibacillus contaminans]|uniref:Uncharacterized protein n=2 Tax=Paenibacillus contaminans TaxID=450362 RepID=A0A329MKQ2_9BACL|nr:hypothetical protein DQG23_17265 [Paenibacillus contaminans]